MEFPLCIKKAWTFNFSKNNDRKVPKIIQACTFYNLSIAQILLCLHKIPSGSCSVVSTLSFKPRIKKYSVQLFENKIYFSVYRTKMVLSTLWQQQCTYKHTKSQQNWATLKLSEKMEHKSKKKKKSKKCCNRVQGALELVRTPLT